MLLDRITSFCLMFNRRRQRWGWHRTWTPTTRSCRAVRAMARMRARPWCTSCCSSRSSWTSVKTLVVGMQLLSAVIRKQTWCCQLSGQARSPTRKALAGLLKLLSFDNLQLLEELKAAGLTPNAKTHELLADSAIIAGDVPAMLAALQVKFQSA